jgi:hypothetical protein
MAEVEVDMPEVGVGMAKVEVDMFSVDASAGGCSVDASTGGCSVDPSAGAPRDQNTDPCIDGIDIMFRLFSIISFRSLNDKLKLINHDS